MIFNLKYCKSEKKKLTPLYLYAILAPLPQRFTVESKSSADEDDDTINVVCPETTDGAAVFIPYPYDCNLYYMCEGFTPTLMSCPPGLEFDAGLNVCNWPFAAGCVATPRPIELEPEVTTEELPAVTTEDAEGVRRLFNKYKNIYLSSH